MSEDSTNVKLDFSGGVVKCLDCQTPLEDDLCRVRMERLIPPDGRVDIGAPLCATCFQARFDNVMAHALVSMSEEQRKALRNTLDYLQRKYGKGGGRISDE